LPLPTAPQTVSTRPCISMAKTLAADINTSLTTAANEAVDDAIAEVFVKTVNKAVKDQAKKLERTFAAAVNDAVRDRVKNLQAVHKRTMENKKATEIRIDKAVKKAVLEAKIKEMEFAILVGREMYNKLKSDYAGPEHRLYGLDGHLHERMDEWKKILAEHEEAQEEKVQTERGTVKRGSKHQLPHLLKPIPHRTLRC
ncbi:hypothetical protein KCU94_g3464, partial [Aureobasidium melanogenum]